MEYDYKKIGLKSGLEIHQQLNTSKLFCSCPSLLRSDEPLRIIKRVLNPVAGQTGAIDPAALHEKAKNLTFNYHVYDTNCLVELDEEPPHNINEEALQIVLQIAHLLNCHIFPVAQVMRKTVIDGSNTSGFQRTVMIAYGGYIETSSGKVRIDSVALEEDSARKVKTEKNIKTYTLDRLGIPLIEITTAPDLKSPEQIKEAALKIGEILRACNVKRGIGTIRQDVNISIKGSKRVEIKGFQDPKIMFKTIDTEIARQQKCVNDKSCKGEVRKTNPDGTTTFLRPMPGEARMYPETDVPLLTISHALISKTKKNLPKLSSENKGYLKEFGLNDELITLLLKSGKIEEFKTLTHITKEYNLIAKTLTIFSGEIAKKENKSSDEIAHLLNTHTLEAVLEKVGSEIEASDVKPILQKLVQGVSLKEAMKKSEVDLDTEAKNFIKEKPGLSQGAYMGLIMSKFKGQVSGKEVSETLRKILK